MNSSELARQGDPHAIADLINRNLQPKGIAAKTSIKESCLKILLEAEDVPDQKILANYIYQGAILRTVLGGDSAVIAKG